MAYLMLGIVMIFLSIVFRLAAVFRLTIPLLYALIVPTIFHEWYHSNQQLGDLIGYLLLAAVALSWVISLVRKIRGLLLRRTKCWSLSCSTVCGRHKCMGNRNRMEDIRSRWMTYLTMINQAPSIPG